MFGVHKGDTSLNDVPMKFIFLLKSQNRTLFRNIYCKCNLDFWYIKMNMLIVCHVILLDPIKLSRCIVISSDNHDDLLSLPISILLLFFPCCTVLMTKYFQNKIKQ